MLNLLTTLILFTQATPLEYGTCGNEPTKYFESQGYGDTYIIHETFKGKSSTNELYEIEIVRPYGNTHFVVAKYNLTLDPTNCSIIMKTALL